MKAVKAVMDYLVNGNVTHVFGIPAGSVNAFFDELYDTPSITPVVTKHEGLLPIWLPPTLNTPAL